MAAHQHIHPADCCAPAKTDGMPLASFLLPPSRLFNTLSAVCCVVLCCVVRCTGAEVDSMSIKELKAYLIERKIDYSDCLEKSDFVAKVKQAVKDGVKKVSNTAPTAAAGSSSAAAAAGGGGGGGSSSRTCILTSKEVGPLKCNMCIIGDPVTKKAVLVDPGGDSDEIIKLIKSLGVTIEQILITHAHFDHIASAGDVKAATGGTAPICMNKSDQQLWQLFPMQYALIGLPAPSKPLPPVDHFLNDGDALKGGVSGGRCIHTPGHSPGSTCYYWPSQKLLCSGDTLFRLSVGRTDLLGGDPNQLKASIQQKLYSLPDDTEVCCGAVRCGCDAVMMYLLCMVYR